MKSEEQISMIHAANSIISVEFSKNQKKMLCEGRTTI